MSDTVYDYIKECLENAFENDSITWGDDTSELVGDLISYSDVAYIYAAEKLVDEDSIMYEKLEEFLTPMVEIIKHDKLAAHTNP